MAQSLYHGRRLSEQVLNRLTEDAVKARLARRMPDDFPLSPRLPVANLFTPEGLARRREFLKETYGFNLDALDGESPPAPETLRGNIENHIGYATLPLGLIGPLRINGLNAHGDYLIPLATTEGALVASYHRGAHVLSLSGGVSSCCLAESLARAPGFVFKTITEALGFMSWVVQHAEEFPPLVAESTRHGQLLDIKLSSCGALVYLIFEYETGDAAGQNMVTLATDRICRYIVKHSPYPPQRWYVEANLSGDKKASMLSFQTARGKKVVASATIPARLTQRFLHCHPEEMATYCEISSLGGIQSGTIGVQGHYANALAALFICCGQDVACVAEASVGITQMKVNDQNELEVSVTLPNLIVGTVGGGTHLPSAKACLELLGCSGTGKARAFSEICAATVLAGEVSIIAALASGEFASAHAKYRPAKPDTPAT